MLVTLYDNKSDINVINKELVEKGRLEISSRLASYSLNITIILQHDLLDINYLKIDNKYYIITDIKKHPQNYKELFCVLDVLETYKKDILDSLMIVKVSKNTNLYINNYTSTYDLRPIKKVVPIEVPKKVLQESNILCCVGCEKKG